MNRVINFINREDIKLFYIINDKIKCSFLDKIIPLITNLGGAVSTILTCLILIYFGNDEVKMAGYKSITALSTSHVLVHFLKKIFTRERPFVKLKRINTFKNKLFDYSFPSGHTTAIFSICITLALNFSVFTLFFIAIAFVVGLSRIYIGVHYPSDVLVGMIIGTIFAITNNVFLDMLIFS
ncbi:undecaprenyl-diphosphatase [Caloranaerobacter azorensis DSM 13643]|uniref:Undecaprenyl-diphosphatase n=1 Tax=Caloranaerobacter azorensis DSM 13643 TaxID=1121264 RepID=A0A1M5R6Z5_9FIRM|nr:phosphatase PAP2 family protein [Caloranaerobacter azorensis]SHH21981.1 undecaprenyl-diphosphatase [Caloranaerobacter azorensis DSM 13643]